MKKAPLKLTIEPTTAVHQYNADIKRGGTNSLYGQLKVMGKLSVWNKIKEKLFEKEGRKCWICGVENTRLNAHEFWKYLPGRQIARNYKGEPIGSYRVKRLGAIHHLCIDCHMVKHADFVLLEEESIFSSPIPRHECIDARLERARELKEKREKLVEHFCKVNQCPREVFYEYWHRVRGRIKRIQKEIHWEPDYGKYGDLLKALVRQPNASPQP